MTDDAGTLSGREFSDLFLSLTEIGRATFAIEIARRTPGQSEGLLASIHQVMQPLEDWIRTGDPSAARRAFEAFTRIDDLTEQMEPGPRLIVTAISYAVQVAAWSAVAAGQLASSDLDSGYYEGSWWFRKSVWEAATTKVDLVSLASDIAQRLAARADRSPFSQGIGDFDSNDADIPLWVAMEP